ncbi:hypothetical protein LINPERHAP1_LOCUS11581, partial [Linum perenne]
AFRFWRPKCKIGTLFLESYKHNTQNTKQYKITNHTQINHIKKHEEQK